MDIFYKCLSLCSAADGGVTPGSYAYESFKKIPHIKGLSAVVKTLNNFTGQGGESNRKLTSMEDLINAAGKVIGGKFDINDFIRLQPESTFKDKQSNLVKLINNDDVVVKKIKKSNYQQLIKQHQKSQQKFTDPEFPPSQLSIGKVDSVSGDTSWKRISQVIKDPVFVQGNIQPSDILQGSLGNCYFLSAIAALAQNDFRIKNLFPNLQINPHGIYMARIMFRGVLHEVVVDDYIPINSKDEPIFAKANGGQQIWVIILEKCWAKLHKNYGEIVGGLPNQVLHAFTGAPTFYRKVRKQAQKQQQLWNQILELQKKGGVLCCGTKCDASIQKVGLVQGHAYTILGVYQKPQRILKIRNPWGSREWTGKLSEKDNDFWSKLTLQQIQELGYTKNNDGIFFMAWEDFMDYFVMIDICKINDNANYINLDSKFNKKNGLMFQLQTGGGDITLALSQRSLRSQDSKRQALGYSRSTLVVARQLLTGKYEYVDSSSSRLFSDHYLQLFNVPKGKYVVFAKFDWMAVDVEQACISVYTQSKTMVKQSKQICHPKFLHSVFENKARNSAQKKALNNNSAEYCSQFLFSKGGYGYYFLEVDKDSNKGLKIQLNGKQFSEKMLVLKKPDKGQVITKEVKPGESILILYRLKAVSYPAMIQTPSPKISVV